MRSLSLNVLWCLLLWSSGFVLAEQELGTATEVQVTAPKASGLNSESEAVSHDKLVFAKESGNKPASASVEQDSAVKEFENSEPGSSKLSSSNLSATNTGPSNTSPSNTSSSNKSQEGGTSLATTNKSESTVKYEPMNSWPVVIGTLFAMVACILALAWFARRFNGLNIARNRDMEVISTLSVGTRERITLVNVKGQTLLIGVTAQQISCLHTFDSEAGAESTSPSPRPESLNAAKPNISDFAATLKGIMGGASASSGVDKSDPSRNEEKRS